MDMSSSASAVAQTWSPRPSSAITGAGQSEMDVSVPSRQFSSVEMASINSLV